jgi:polysaccharide biosynthesis/export protein
MAAMGWLSPRFGMLTGSVALAVAAGLGGCEAVPGAGPWMNDASSRTTVSLQFDVIDLTPITVVAYRAETDTRPAEPIQPPSGHVVIQPGDTVQVRIFERKPGGLYPTILGPDIKFASQRVDEQGNIDVLFAGKVRLAGLDPHQAETEIAHRLESRVKDPLVMVQFVGGRTDSIMVSGDVVKPGRQSLLDGTRSVIDAVNRAGGPADIVPPKPGVNDTLVRTPVASGTAAPPAAGSVPTTSESPQARDADTPTKPVRANPMQIEVALRRHGGVVLDKTLAELQSGGDIGVQDGDEIVVRQRSQVITLLGAVEKAGNLPMTKPDMSLADVMGEARGLMDDRANKSGLFVFRLPNLRQDPSARGRVFHLDLAQPQSMLVAQQFTMQPADVIFVTNAPVYDYYKIITPLYKTLAIYPISTGVEAISITY